MDLRLTAAEAAFRDELVEWLHSVLPTLPARPPERDYWARREFDAHWQQLLHARGYAGINWPKEFGGRGATPTEHLIYLEESQRLGAPKAETHFVGQEHAGPTLIMEATAEQKAAHLPRILNGTEVWCQGFSEPNAGSDLASLSTRAVRDGDYYVVTGQKIWTSFAHIADYCELLVRTNVEAPKHRGITWLICPMDLAGIEARPIRTVVDSSEFCETFFDEVRVPVANRVGDENDGWRVAMVTFSFERGTGFLNELLSAQRELHELVAVAKKVTRRGALAWDDAEIRRELGRLQADFDALWALDQAQRVAGRRAPAWSGPGGSVFKLHYADVSKRMGELAFRVLDRMALTTEAPDELTEVELAARRIRSFTVSIAAVLRRSNATSSASESSVYPESDERHLRHHPAPRRRRARPYCPDLRRRRGSARTVTSSSAPSASGTPRNIAWRSRSAIVSASGCPTASTGSTPTSEPVPSAWPRCRPIRRGPTRRCSSCSRTRGRAR